MNKKAQETWAFLLGAYLLAAAGCSFFTACFNFNTAV